MLEETNKEKNQKFAEYVIEKLEGLREVHTSIAATVLSLTHADVQPLHLKLSETPYVFRRDVERFLLKIDILPEICQLDLYEERDYARDLSAGLVQGAKDCLNPLC